jgi:hypothetical protein
MLCVQQGRKAGCEPFHRRYVDFEGSSRSGPEQFQEKCIAVFRPELRENRELERFRVSVKKTETL